MDQADRIYKLMKQAMGGRTFDASNFLHAVTIAISVVQEANNEPHNGPYKKLLVLNLLKRAMQDGQLGVPPEDRDTVIQLLDIAVPAFIDVSISIAHGVIDLGKGRATPCCLIS